MAARERFELREINGVTFLVKYSEVDHHEGYTVSSYNVLREARKADFEKFPLTNRK